MSESSRRSSGRRRPIGSRPTASLEALERRELLTLPPAGSQSSLYVPQGILAPASVDYQSAKIATPKTGTGARQLSFLDNDGKVLTGKDRQGDEWQIVVHGPGAVIVTDATPNDGALDDDINTIQLVGTDPHKTNVVGQVTSSARVVTDGTVLFNHLTSINGVNSIVLNGFTLAQTVLPTAGDPNNAGPEVYLPQGVGLLQFHNIEAPIDLAVGDNPIDIIIGQENSPLERSPIIRLDSIFNTVFDSTLGVNPNGVPPTAPTVNITVNGDIKELSFISSTQAVIPAASQFAFPVVGTTGRTAVRALSVGNLKASGSVRNFTASKQAQPFTSGYSGLNKLGTAKFGGVTDIVGLDVNGPIKGLKFARGLGDPAGALTGATQFGLPDAERGATSFGLQGGLVTSTRIGHVKAGPANIVLQATQDPDYVQSKETGFTTWYARPGRALTGAAIVSSGSIGQVQVRGDLQSTEIKTGFHYPSFQAGLEGTRAASRIRHVHIKGSLVDSVVSSTYRPTNGVYGDVNAQGQTDDVAGPGRIAGRQKGVLLSIGSDTPLANTGAGTYARRKVGQLPPPEVPTRVNSVLVSP